MINRKKIAIVDVCHTLYQENTTIGFINYISGTSYRVKLLRLWAIKAFFIILGRVIKKDLYRILYVRSLKGRSRTELYRLALSYHDNILRNIKNDSVYSLIVDNREFFNYRLCSASLDIIISAIVEKNDLFDKEYKSSKLEYDRYDVCTGRLACDLLGKKAAEFDTPDWVITDNISDLELIRKSKKTTVVARKKNIDFWTRNGIKVDIIV